MTIIALLLAGTTAAMICVAAFVRWGTRWGATAAERSAPMAGDDWLEGGPAARVAMTRGLSINRTPEIVWPWIAQLGRGAGFYSIDWLDNGRRSSARHLVSWIPAARLGDASAIGYLRHLQPGRELAWWVPGERFLGATTRMAVSAALRPDGQGARLVIRISGDAAGPGSWLVGLLFPVVDSIMARRQLLGIRERAERHGARTADPEAPETGARDQYQFFEVIYASGERAGVAGKEAAALWRAAALEAGAVEARSGEVMHG
ncbi:MAG: hypothetical protein HYV63_12490 [Candidatus Schekmanbacteria bacterium]|nr:hypothetical protein [Candidatus Schekmanbacteria bacterium]